MWIYSLEEKKSKKIPKGTDIPKGWLKGRIVNFENNCNKISKEEKINMAN